MEVIINNPLWATAEDGQPAALLPRRHYKELITESLDKLILLNPNLIVEEYSTGMWYAKNMIDRAHEYFTRQLDMLPSPESECVPGVCVLEDGKFLIFGHIQRGLRLSKYKRFLRSLPISGYTTMVVDGNSELIDHKGERIKIKNVITSTKQIELVMLFDASISMSPIIESLVEVQESIVKDTGFIGRVHYIAINEYGDERAKYLGSTTSSDYEDIVETGEYGISSDVAEYYDAGFSKALEVMTKHVNDIESTVVLFIYDSYPHTIAEGAESDWREVLHELTAVCPVIGRCTSAYQSAPLKKFTAKFREIVEDSPKLDYMNDALHYAARIFDTWTEGVEAAIRATDSGMIIGTHALRYGRLSKAFLSKPRAIGDVAVEYNVDDIRRVLIPASYGNEPLIRFIIFGAYLLATHASLPSASSVAFVEAHDPKQEVKGQVFIANTVLSEFIWGK